MAKEKAGKKEEVKETKGKAAGKADAKAAAKGKEAKAAKKKEAPKVEVVSKSTLIEEVAAVTEISKKDATAVINAYQDKIVEHVSAGRQVQLKGFATFGYRVKQARTGRNPQTGDAIEIAEQPITFARVGREFKRTVKESYGA